jgi:hypothetical protein
MVLHEITRHLTNKRKIPQISLKNVLRIMSIGISQNNVSSHHLDISGRIDTNKTIAKSKRKKVCSDTQLERLLSKFIEIPDNLPYLIYTKVKQYLPANNEKRLLIIDGTEQSKRLYSIGALYSGSPFFVEMEKQEKHVKELNASENLVRRIASLWKDEFDLILGDALYFNINDFKTALDFGKHFFVKTREDNLQVIKETESAYKLERAFYWKNVKEKTYLDIERKISYKVFVYNGFQYRDLSKTLNCYHVEETFLSDNRQEIFYCIITADNISPAEAREIAKKRWQIENNVSREG